MQCFKEFAGFGARLLIKKANPGMSDQLPKWKNKKYMKVLYSLD